LRDKTEIAAVDLTPDDVLIGEGLHARTIVVGRPRSLSPSVSTTACWNSVARNTFAPHDLGAGRGHCGYSIDPCTTVTRRAVATTLRTIVE
jgi:hypothetical protein